MHKNPSRVTHERTVQARMSLSTQYMPASTSNMQVTRVQAGKKSYTQVCLPLSTGALWYFVASITASLVYVLAITYHAFISEKVTPP